MVNNAWISAAAAHRRQRGFTLVEVMIVVVIMGILTSVAFPAYKAYVDRAKRTEGKALLSEIAARQERYYFDNNTYANDATLLGYSTKTPQSSEAHYALVDPIAAGDSGNLSTSYKLTIQPVAPHNDATCDKLLLDSKGVGTSSTGNPICWAK